MVHIKHRIGIKASAQKVYDALSTVKGVSEWWTQHTTGHSEVGKTLIVKFHSLEGNELGSMHIEIQDLKPHTKVHWKFTAGPKEWIGTEVIFDLKEEDGYTIVLFSHINWKQEVEFKSHCSMKWAIFMLSLKEYLETGKGQPAPNDIKIDNWN